RLPMIVPSAYGNSCRDRLEIFAVKLLPRNRCVDGMTGIYSERNRHSALGLVVNGWSDRCHTRADCRWPACSYSATAFHSGWGLSVRQLFWNFERTKLHTPRVSRRLQN